MPINSLRHSDTINLFLLPALLLFFFFFTGILHAETPIEDPGMFSQYGFDESKLSHRQRHIYSPGPAAISFTINRADAKPFITMVKAEGGSQEELTVTTVLDRGPGGRYDLTILPPEPGLYHVDISVVKPGAGWTLPPILTYIIFFGLDNNDFLPGPPPPGIDTTTGTSGNPVKVPQAWLKEKLLDPAVFSHPNRIIHARNNVVITIPADERLEFYAEVSWAIMTEIGWIGKIQSWQGGTPDRGNRGILKQYRDRSGVTFELKPPQAGLYLLEIAVRRRDNAKFRRFLEYTIHVEEGKGTAFPVPDQAIISADRAYTYSAIDAHAQSVKHNGSMTISELARRITAPARNDREKVRALYTWVSKNIRYDHANFNDSSIPHNHNGLIALREKIGICNTYSKLFLYLCMESGIPCVYEEGRSWHQSMNGFKQSHAWNRVLVDGTWRLVDTTWGAVQHDAWFFTDPGEFFKTHETAIPEQWRVDPATLPYTGK